MCIISQKDPKRKQESLTHEKANEVSKKNGPLHFQDRTVQQRLTFYKLSLFHHLIFFNTRTYTYLFQGKNLHFHWSHREHEFSYQKRFITKDPAESQNIIWKVPDSMVLNNFPH
jgi:hypothetical protein